MKTIPVKRLAKFIRIGSIHPGNTPPMEFARLCLRSLPPDDVDMFCRPHPAVWREVGKARRKGCVRLMPQSIVRHEPRPTE